MPRVPVAVFMTSFDAGGTERQMTELIRRLDDGRYRVHAVCFRREGRWLSRVEERAASIVDFPIRGFNRPSTFVALARFASWCRRERIAVLQACDFYANVFGLPGARLAGVPVRIGSRRELNPDKSDRQITLQRRAYVSATHVVANSPAAREILRVEGVCSPHVALIPNGIDLAAHSSERHTRPIRTVVTVANLRPEKNHETLIAAAATLAHTHPAVRYRIVGDGSRRAELEALARARGVDGIVDFLGHRDDIPDLLASADLFALPSRSEAFPNGAIEAMAAGLPVVASDVGGLRDLIEHGRTGLLVPPANPDALAGAIGSLVDDPARARGIGDAAREEVRGRYSFDRMVAAFDALYQSALDASHGWRALTAQAGI
jgi:glycosyltransferase involved in cell wall biosynthesis